jgi:hypothetical protein
VRKIVTLSLPTADAIETQAAKLDIPQSTVMANLIRDGLAFRDRLTEQSAVRAASADWARWALTNGVYR